MTKVKVTFDFYPEPSEIDETNETGLTEAAFSILTDRLMSLGADDIDVTKAEDDNEPGSLRQHGVEVPYDD